MDYSAARESIRPWVRSRSRDTGPATAPDARAMRSRTIFLAEWARLKLAQWQLNAVLAAISPARTLSEEQLATGRKRNVTASLLAAAVQELRSTCRSARHGRARHDWGTCSIRWPVWHRPGHHEQRKEATVSSCQHERANRRLTSATSSNPPSDP
jgi:hypothetical protein